MAQTTQFDMSEEIVLESESVEGDAEIELKLQAEADEALWNSEHSSDEEPFDSEKPEDLQTENAKEADAEHPVDEEEELSGDEEESDDSIVVGNDVIEYECEDHDACIRAAKHLLDQLLELRELRVKEKIALSALAEMVCDNSKPL